VGEACLTCLLMLQHVSYSEILSRLSKQVNKFPHKLEPIQYPAKSDLARTNFRYKEQDLPPIQALGALENRLLDAIGVADSTDLLVQKAFTQFLAGQVQVFVMCPRLGVFDAVGRPLDGNIGASHYPVFGP
jgi:hypothetical protein